MPFHVGATHQEEEEEEEEAEEEAPAVDMSGMSEAQKKLFQLRLKINQVRASISLPFRCKVSHVLVVYGW